MKGNLMAKRVRRKGLASTESRQKKSKENESVQTQTVMDGVFPDRDDELETAALQLIKLEDQSKKANEKKKVTKDEIAQLMIDKGLESYKCYDSRKELKRNVDVVKMRQVPEKEATPYQPA